MSSQPNQQIVTYRGRDMDHQFQRDAARRAAQGWLVQSSTYGGVARQGCGAMFTLGVFASRKPRELTVIYQRP